MLAMLRTWRVFAAQGETAGRRGAFFALRGERIREGEEAASLPDVPGRLKRPSGNGRDRSPHRSCEWVANESSHEKLGSLLMDGHSLIIRADRPEVGPCLRGLSRQPL